MARAHEPTADYDSNPDDERLVDLSDEGELPAPPPTLDPEERLEDLEDTLTPYDDDREEPVW